MKHVDFKLIGMVGIVFGVFNIIPVFAEMDWYRILCFLILGVPEVITGIFVMGSDKPNVLRTQSWINTIAGLAIIALAFSSFYASPTLSAFNFIAAAGLIISGVYGLIACGTRYRISIAP